MEMYYLLGIMLVIIQISIKFGKVSIQQQERSLIVREGMPEESGKVPNLDDLPEEFAPGIGPEEFQAIAKRLLAKM